MAAVGRIPGGAGGLPVRGNPAVRGAVQAAGQGGRRRVRRGLHLEKRQTIRPRPSSHKPLISNDLTVSLLESMDRVVWLNACREEEEVQGHRSTQGGLPLPHQHNRVQRPRQPHRRHGQP